MTAGAIIGGASSGRTKAQWLSPGEGVRAAAKVWFEDGSVYAENDKGERRGAPVGKVKFSARMAGLPRRITFDDGIVVVVEDNDFIDAAMGGRGLLYRMEAHWRGIFSFVAASAFVLWVLVVYALPVASAAIAAQVPQKTLESLSEETYAHLKENDFLSPSKLPPEDIVRAEKIFLRAVGKDNDDGFRYQLRLHRMHLFGGGDDDDDDGVANAFAFPDGLVVATDSLARILTDKELEAVFAHEISHIRRRHGLRAVMESSAVFLLSSLLFGDISFVLSGGAAVLVQQKISRNFEREADCDAYRYLRERGEPEEAMASAFTKLEAEYEKIADAAGGDDKPEDDDENAADDAGDKDDESTAQKAARRVFELLSTHPATRERVDFANHCHG